MYTNNYRTTSSRNFGQTDALAAIVSFVMTPWSLKVAHRDPSVVGFTAISRLPLRVTAELTLPLQSYYLDPFFLSVTES